MKYSEDEIEELTCTCNLSFGKGLKTLKKAQTGYYFEKHYLITPTKISFTNFTEAWYPYLRMIYYANDMRQNRRKLDGSFFVFGL